MTAKTTRISAGHYDVSVGGQQFNVDQYPDGSWLLFEVRETRRDFCNDFATKRAAVDAAILCAGEVA